MQSFYRPTWAEVDLDVLSHNIRAFRRHINERIRMFAVVKANAYGHGAVEIAKEALGAGADALAVAFLDEALQLRNHGIEAPVLVMGYTDPDGYKEAIEKKVTLTLFDATSISDLTRVAKEIGEKPKIHVKVDTGMGRLGYTELADMLELVRAVDRESLIELDGIFTHYSSADEIDKTYTEQQFRKFQSLIDQAGQEGIRPPWVHAGNSATAIELPDFTFDAIRLGIAMYGLPPSKEVNGENLPLKPVLSLKSQIVFLKEVPPNTGISYGAAYRTTKREKIATVPIGYADGYTRLLTGQGEALVRGKRVPIVGRICMDQLMLEVTDLPDVRVGDEVVLIGSQGDEEITANELAAKLGTINYEITCKISARVPRVYLKNNQIVQTINAMV